MLHGRTVTYGGIVLRGKTVAYGKTVPCSRTDIMLRGHILPLGTLTALEQCHAVHRGAVSPCTAAATIIKANSTVPCGGGTRYTKHGRIQASLRVMLYECPCTLSLASEQKRRDERMSVVNETMNGIRIIKLFAWEPNFVTKVMDARNLEMVLLRSYMFTLG